jgi:hypothetical protein
VRVSGASDRAPSVAIVIAIVMGKQIRMTEITPTADEHSTNAYDPLIAALAGAAAIGVMWIAVTDIAGGNPQVVADPRSPAFFPTILAILLLILAAAIFFRPRAAETASGRPSGTRATAAIVTGAALLAGYVYGFFALGFVTASALAMIGIAWLAGERRWAILLPLAVIFPLLLKVVAERALAILLPKGLFW